MNAARLLVIAAMIGCHEQAAAEGLFLPADAPSQTAISRVGNCRIKGTGETILIVVRGDRADLLDTGSSVSVPFVLDADGQGGSALGGSVQLRNGALTIHRRNQIAFTGTCRAVELPTTPPLILPIMGSEEIPRPVAMPADVPSCAVLVGQAKLGEVTADVAALIQQACR